MRVYLAGPMRGLPGWNFAEFDRVEKLWTAAGHQVFSPARTCRALGYAPPEGSSSDSHVDRQHLLHVIQTDLACIYACDAVVVLDGWESSRGATVEVALAQFLNLPIYDADNPSRSAPAVPTPWKYVVRLANGPEGVGHSY